MGMKEIFEKLLNGASRPKHDRVNAVEQELASFKERERQDNLKKELAFYRKKNSNELIIGRLIPSQDTVLSQENVIMNAPNVFAPQHNQQRALAKKPSLLDMEVSEFW